MLYSSLWHFFQGSGRSTSCAGGGIVVAAAGAGERERERSRGTEFASPAAATPAIVMPTPVTCARPNSAGGGVVVAAGGVVGAASSVVVAAAGAGESDRERSRGTELAAAPSPADGAAYAAAAMPAAVTCDGAFTRGATTRAAGVVDFGCWEAIVAAFTAPATGL